MTCAVGLIGYLANAQFHIEFGSNFNLPQGDFADAYDLGIGFYLEPKYAIHENIDLGLVIGSDGFVGTDGKLFGATSALSALVILPTATYRFSTNTVIPSAGLGLGLYNFKEADVTIAGIRTKGESESKFGFAPRIGVYIGRLNLGAAYNIVSDANYIQINPGVRILSRK